MKKKPKHPFPNNSFTEFLLYTSPGGKVKMDIFLRNETIWLNQEKIALLFGVQRPAITKHLKNIFDSSELNEFSVSSILEHTAEDGKVYKTKFYNLDAIISVGYRVNSTQATHFRIWNMPNEFEKYKVIQDKLFESDFDKEVKKISDKMKSFG
jgi:hypothetical protein